MESQLSQSQSDLSYNTCQSESMRFTVRLPLSSEDVEQGPSIGADNKTSAECALHDASNRGLSKCSMRKYSILFYIAVIAVATVVAFVFVSFETSQLGLECEEKSYGRTVCCRVTDLCAGDKDNCLCYNIDDDYIPDCCIDSILG